MAANLDDILLALENIISSLDRIEDHLGIQDSQPRAGIDPNHPGIKRPKTTREW